MKFIALASAVAASALLATATVAVANHHGTHPQSVTVGGAVMLPTRTIVENAANSPILTTLVSAVTAAGLVQTLSGPGPFTVFAPTNAAFSALPSGTVETLVQPENKATLTRILTYHVVAGRVTAADVVALIQKGGGSASITTVSGATLTASIRGGSVILTDAKGRVATVTQADVFQSNGVVHVIDAVVLPN